MRCFEIRTECLETRKIDGSEVELSAVLGLRGIMYMFMTVKSALALENPATVLWNSSRFIPAARSSNLELSDRSTFEGIVSSFEPNDSIVETPDLRRQIPEPIIFPDNRGREPAMACSHALVRGKPPP